MGKWQKGAALEKAVASVFRHVLYQRFTFGGGFVIVTFMKRKFVDTLHWLDERE